MSRMAREGKKKKADAKAAKWAERMNARARNLKRRPGVEAWKRLGRLFKKAGDHGAATKERLLELVALHFGHEPDKAELVLHQTALQALRTKDPLTELNRALNEEEAKPHVDKSWTNVPAEAPVAAPEGA